MTSSILPKTVTKEVLFEEAQKRFQSWAKMYGDPDISAQYMYEDMSCSCYCGGPEDDFPIQVKAERDSVIRYQYKDGSCSFTVDDIEVEVLDLRSMRKDPEFGEARFTDICTLSISYKEDSIASFTHLIPDTWLYGSTTDEFNEGMPVHQEFIDAARDFIKAHHITKEMQEVQ